MMFNNPNSYEEVKSLISEDEYKKIYSERKTKMMALVTIIDTEGHILHSEKLIPSKKEYENGFVYTAEFDFMCSIAREDLMSFNYLSEGITTKAEGE